MDPRITDQQEYLSGVELVRRNWSSPDPNWDHDHCAFCWGKFAAPGMPGAMQAGYVTLDGRHWICGVCYQDFNQSFEWKVVVA